MINVKDWGAKGDLVTDDAPAIQAAINAALAGNAGGGKLYFPLGNYGLKSGMAVLANGPGLVFEGDGGYSFNESAWGSGASFHPYWGSCLVALADGISIITYGHPTVLGMCGPIIRGLNFIGKTPAPNSAKGLVLQNINRWAMRDCSVRDLSVGVSVRAMSTDCSWGRVDQLIARNVNIAVEQPDGEGGFLMTGGDIEALLYGVRTTGPQVRIVGVKFDGPGGPGTAAIRFEGHDGQAVACQFEKHTTGVQIVKTAFRAWSGNQHAVSACHFRGSDVTPGVHISVGAGCCENQLGLNSYEAGAQAFVNVQDQGTRTFVADSWCNPQGPQGPQGPAGAPGAQGPIGPAGPAAQFPLLVQLSPA